MGLNNQTSGMSVWTSYTPSFVGMGTVSTQSFWYKSDGVDSIFIKGTWTTGTVSAAAATISLPSGYTIKSTKVNGTAELCAMFTSNTLNASVYTALLIPSATTLSFSYNSNTGGGLATGQLGSVVFVSTTTFSFSTTAIPIS